MAKGPRKLFPEAFIIPRAQSNLVLPIGCATGKIISISWTHFEQNQHLW